MTFDDTLLRELSNVVCKFLTTRLGRFYYVKKSNTFYVSFVLKSNIKCVDFVLN